MTHPTPADVETIVGLICQSIEHANNQRLPEALACLDAGLRIHPAFFPCRVARSKVLAAMQRFDEALADLADVLRLVELPDALAGFADIFEAGMAHIASRLEANRDDHGAYFQRGRLHWHARNPVAALHDYERALALDSGDIALHMARGDTLFLLGRFDDAVASYDRILHSEPANAAACYNRGNALQALGLLNEAIASYRQATAVSPQFAEAHMEQAHCRLAQGELAEGWELFEWRWQTSQLGAKQLTSAQPRWLGQADLTGKTILLWAEQGYGDTIQFARFVPRVAGKVILRAPEPLRLLLSTLHPHLTIISDSDPQPAHDFHAPLMSLPLALGVNDDAALGAGAYLHADAGRTQAWQARLGATGRPRVGLCWAGRRSGAAACNPSRDASLAAFLPLAGLDAEFVCLQQEYTAAEDALLAALPNFRAVRQGLGHFADTAALLANLDLVITVDTAIAHLAGALGTPCWLLLRKSGEWRWRRERLDTPWYPTIRIFRQQAQGDWNEVVRRVMQEFTCCGGDGPAGPARPSRQAA